MLDLGFKVTEDMAEKEPTHNGHIRPDIYDQLLDLAVHLHRAKKYESMNMAVTGVLCAFWEQWKAL